MKNFILALLLFVFIGSLNFFSTLSAQIPSDDLIEECNQLIKQANQLVEQRAVDQVDSVLQILKLKSEAADYKKGLFEYFSISGEMKNKEKDYSSVVALFEKAIAADLIKDLPADDVVHPYNRLVYAYCRLRDKENTSKYSRLSLDLLDEISDPALKANVFQMAGVREDAFGTTRQALFYNEKAKVFYEEDKDTSNICAINYNIGVNYREMGIIDSASMYFKENLELAKRRNDSVEKLYSYDALATDAIELGDIEASLEYLK